MKRIAFIFLRLLVILYAIIAFPIWIFSIIFWVLWNIFLLFVALPMAWVFLGGWYDTSNTSSRDKKCDWLFSLKWWREKLKWDSWAYDYDLTEIPQWYLYYLRKMSEYCD